MSISKRKIASNKNALVFDPFMGVGSTGVAAKELNRDFIGYEIDPEFFEAAKKRINGTKPLMKEEQDNAQP